ncbi:hypothetical protein HYALB_00009454 [Hymenoscyphus albidus]|uniref:Ankyrin n=1 Tax=Hymenoscyphus albidus TaxID=595503 RepID=A0A9N9LQE4_9HELO|nr:hypothetical protein HYALB_00009454 [Hymenoscyphus albidus]
MFLKSLQSAKEDPELSVSENLGPEEIAREMRLRFIFKKAELFPRMRRTVYFFVLNTFCSGIYPTLSYQGGLTMSVRSTIHKMLSSDVLERHEGDLQRRLDRLLGPTSTPDAFFEALAIAIQLGSNGRLESERDILVWLAAQKMSILEALFDLKLPSIQVFLENLVHCTLDFHRHEYTLKNRSINTPRMQPVYRAARTLLTADRQHHIFAGNKTRRITTALELDHIDMVAILLKEGVDTNASIIIEGRPVTLLAIANSIETSRLLIEAGADLNATFPAWRASANWTALSCATDVPGCSKLVRYLLSVGAGPPLATQNLEAPSLTDTHAKESRNKFQELYTGDSEAFWLLRQADLKVGFRVNLRPDDISLSDEDHVRNCIACDDENVKQGFPAFEGWHEMLLYSIEKNLPKLIDLFLKTRFNVNAEIRSFYGQSLIEVAHTLGRPELVSQLMLHGVREVIREPIQDSIEDPTVLSVKKAVEDGELFQNILEGSMKLEELLRDNLFHHEGLWSVLEELVRLVLHDLPWEIITNVSPQCQQFVLITAIEYDEMESAAKLVQEGVELKLLEGNQAGHFPEQQRTILQLVCFKASLGWACGQLVQTMLHYGALQHEPETHCYKGYEALRLADGWTALQAAVINFNPNEKLISFLLQKGADVNAPAGKSEGITALQGAAIEGQITIVKRLLELGADPNAPGAEEEGRTALEGASETGRLDTVVLLLNNGAIPAMEAVWYAEREGHFVIGDIIRKQLPEFHE